LKFEGSSPDEFVEVPFFMLYDVASIKDKPLFTITERSSGIKLQLLLSMENLEPE